MRADGARRNEAWPPIAAGAIHDAAAHHGGTNPWLDAIRNLTRIPRTPPVPKSENHNPGCVDAINDAIRGVLDFPVRRAVNFGDHAPAARELA